LIPLPAEAAGEVITAVVLLFLLSFPSSIWQGGILLRGKQKLQQARLLEDTEQATCASPPSQSKRQRRFSRGLWEQPIALE